MAEERIGRYRILDEIASGTQGAVYRCFDPETTRIVAVKVLHPTLTGNQSFLERFRREATLASSIEHPNVVGIFEIGEVALANTSRRTAQTLLPDREVAVETRRCPSLTL